MIFYNLNNTFINSETNLIAFIILKNNLRIKKKL